jgi:hypothetical protein
MRYLSYISPVRIFIEKKRMLNASEDRTPARTTYWLRNRNNTITASLARSFSKENAIHMINNNISQLSQKDKRDIIVCELEARSRGMNNVGSSITFDTNIKLRACFQADVLTNRRRRYRLQSPAEKMNQAEWHNSHRQQRRAPEQSALQPLNYIWNIYDANIHRWFYYPP